MPSWSELLNMLKQAGGFDELRRQYIRLLSEKTKRNVIIYYSSFITKKAQFIDICDDDMNGFIETTNGLDTSKGLDLILHTPGGDPVATESIVNYLRDIFNKDIRVIIPHMAMSAGTMIACSSKEIIMGYQSSLGPIDPQFSGIPALNIKSEFEEAKSELSKDQTKFFYWKIILDKYNKADYKTVCNAIDLSEILATNWLNDCMFKDNPDKESIVKSIVSKLNENAKSKYHSRHFNHQFCKDIGLKVSNIEEDPVFQDLVLSIHHMCMFTFDGTSAIKIIENQLGKAIIKMLPQNQK